MASGCAPTLAIELDFDDASCIGSDARLLVAIEDGPCGEALGELAWSGAVDDAPPTALSPGAYCIDAVALRTGDEHHGHRCRVDAAARENRRLPTEREPVSLAVRCAGAPSPVGDGLLAAAGCNGACDVDRCVCSLGCDVDCIDGTCACPEPIALERLVMGDHYACGLALDHRSFTCWGDEPEATERVPGWEGFAPGVARTELGLVAESDERIVLFDGDGSLFCDRTDRGTARCDHASIDSAFEVRRLSAVGRGFVCVGEADVICASVVEGLTPQIRRATNGAFNYPSRLSAGHDQLCGILSGTVHCTEPLGEAPLLCGTEARPCPWWFQECTAPGCTPWPLRATPIGDRPTTFIELDLGWDRACAIDTARRLWCWSVDPDDPDGLSLPTLQGDVLVPTLVRDVVAQEVAVGAGHVCTREAGGAVFCARLRREGDVLMREGVERFAGEDPVTSFVAGPDGISCAVRSAPGAASRVDCFQLAGFEGSEGLLGHAHTRDVTPDAVDEDGRDLSVCP